MKLEIFGYALGIAALCASSAFGATNPAAGLTTADRAFADDLAHANIAEIDMGKLAQQKGTNSEVKDFGARMERDHTQLDNQLKTWAKTNHVNLPNNVLPADQAEQQKLSGMSGSAFDKAYIETMLTDHQKDIQRVQLEAEQVTDPQVKQLADRTLPILEDHVRMAEYDAGKMGLNATPGLNQPEHPNERPSM